MKSEPEEVLSAQFTVCVSKCDLFFFFSQFGNFLAVKQKKKMKTESFLSNTVIMFTDVPALSVKKKAAGVLQKCLNLFSLLVLVPSFIKRFHPPVFMHSLNSCKKVFTLYL